MNWFIFACGMLQLAGAVTFFLCNNIRFAILYMLYAATNFILATG